MQKSKVNGVIPKFSKKSNKAQYNRQENISRIKKDKENKYFEINVRLILWKILTIILVIAINT